MKQLPPPRNWQDFEELCKVVFGEFWECKYDIQKNGRQGQSQAGVDIFGIPKGEDEYFGIQCKGKDINYGSKLTEKEIDAEIDNAKKFQPKLKQLIFATTAAKDVKIEEYIRIKNVENIKKGYFKVSIQSWDEISTIIQQSPSLMRGYSNNNSFFHNDSINVTFKNELTEIEICPLLALESYKYVPENVSLLYNNPVRGMIGIFGKGISNFSWETLEFHVHNTGSNSIDSWEFIFDIDDNINKIRDANDKISLPHFGEDVTLKHYNELGVIADNDNGTFRFKMVDNKIIRPNEKLKFSIQLLMKINSEFSEINWTLYSSTFNTKGVLNVRFNPRIENLIKSTSDMDLVENNKRLNYYYRDL